MPRNKQKSTDNARLRKELNANYARKEDRLYRRLARSVRIEKPRFWWQERNLWQKLIITLSVIVLFVVGSMYGIARWYIAHNNHKPLVYGATFVPNYAKYFGLEPKATFRAMIDDLGLRHFRLVSYWKDIEREQGKYDFRELDWQFAMAEEAGAEVSLAIGLRQPRWPECHMPAWGMDMTMDEWYPKLKDFMTAVINRYKDSPVLNSYQLENEFFLSVFGECPDFSRERLIDEAKLVRELDPNTTLIISRSNNAVGLPLGDPRPDMFAVSVYKRVWDKTLTRRYFEYPFPAWFYGFLAGAGELITGKDMIIHELQSESWLPEGYEMKSAPLDELYKSMNPDRLRDRIEYGRATGMRKIELWGVEWWYHLKVNYNEPEMWETAKEEIRSRQDPALYN